MQTCIFTVIVYCDILILYLYRFTANSEASNATLIGSLIGFGCLSVVLIGALLFIMLQRSRRRRSDQTKNGVENKGALSTQNLGYT